ncbi:lipopolysaccharide assembly protein [Mucilaginibacter gracilis]|uniref:Lipopolysaccharide assembly protein n=1 Tax=Mucilaginibacter gracilis TaxID=423350 RepID=A0A495JB57_9SPHI|nr:LptE family protein [Mucilaginibacter gracilis]RKR85634.1 lipopolysaccharide assembly protein [Mucilaginibacter gracilis]
MKKKILLLIFPLLLLSQACTYKLSLNGASIPPELKTINVSFFENTAPYVVNNLSQTFTEALKDRIRSQTSLSLVRGEADATLEGQITGYTIAPASVQATSDNRAPVAGLTRLTITIKAKYTNIANKKYNFEESFTRFKDFAGDISSQEQTLIQALNKQLTEDIFNRAFANWA